MKTETSAGGVIVKKLGNTWQLLLIRDMNDNWTFPKGIIQKGESPDGAAVREIGEETGLTELTLVQPLKTITYSFKRDELVYKTVHYFLFRSEQNVDLKAQKEEGISDVGWCDIDTAIDIIGYPKTNKALLLQVKKILPTVS